MVHPERLLLFALVLTAATDLFGRVAAFDDFLDEIFSIFFDSESESESSEPVQVNGKNATINVMCDNCTLTINCPNCNSMTTMAVGGTMMTEPSSAPPAPNGDSATPVTPAASASTGVTNQPAVSEPAAPGSPAATETATAMAASVADTMAGMDAAASEAPPPGLF
ncbi:uncharacterized protein LOC126565217 [Anopheles maculipalpis]|uniref:uncharacterized protein LOC126565217 n=1 Tax=Anopheles maculipalpis TaxID=1496333 RepID=UPI002158A560|nr:uncharacterized protein LOC126565217 [Anopheles maculipalpis]